MQVKQILVTLFLGVSMLGVLGTNPVVHAEDKRTAQFEMREYKKKAPGTWVQSRAPYANETYPLSGAPWGETSCGVHSTAMLFAKVGKFFDGEYDHHTQNTFSTYMLPNKIANQGLVYPVADISYENTGGLLEGDKRHWFATTQKMKEFVIEEYKIGKYVVVSGVFEAQVNSGNSHIAFVDYITEEGDVILCDCGWNYKYIESIHTPIWATAVESKSVKSYDAPIFTNLDEVDGTPYTPGGGTIDSDTRSSEGEPDAENPVISFGETKTYSRGGVGIKGKIKGFLAHFFGGF